MNIDNKIIKEIYEIKNNLIVEKNKILNINELIKNDIDKIHHFDLYSLLPIENNYQMDLIINNLSNSHIPTPDLNSITSHRKYIGNLIVFFKKTIFKLLSPYSNFVLENQRKFNKNIFNYNILLQKRLQNIELKQDEMQIIQKNIADNEDKIVLILDKLNQSEK